MGKTNLQSKDNAPIAKDELSRTLAVLAARKQFLGSSVSMGWQLALVVMIPVIIGVKLDTKYNTSPSYTLTALVLAVIMSVAVVSKTIKQVDSNLAINNSDKENKKRK